jgi:hypothetical protein
MKKVGSQIGIPGVLVAKNMEQVKIEGSELHQKPKKAGMGQDVSSMKLDLDRVLGGKAEQNSLE